MIYNPLPKEKQALMYISPSGVLSMDKTTHEPLWTRLKRKFHNLFQKKIKLIPITDSQNPVACDMLSRQQGEVIAPMPLDTVEDIAGMASSAAADHEYERVIIYPINPEMRSKVLELIQNNKQVYPMFEYSEANIVSNDDLNSGYLFL